MPLTRKDAVKDAEEFIRTHNIQYFYVLNDIIIVATYSKDSNRMGIVYFNIDSKELHALKDISITSDTNGIYRINDETFGWTDDAPEMHQYNINSKVLSSFKIPSNMSPTNLMPLPNDTFLINGRGMHIDAQIFNSELKAVNLEKNIMSYKFGLNSFDTVTSNASLYSFSGSHYMFGILDFNLNLIAQIKIPTVDTVVSHSPNISPDGSYCCFHLQNKQRNTYLQTYLITESYHLIPLRQFASSIFIRDPKWMADGTLFIVRENGYLQYDPRNDTVIDLSHMPILKDFPGNMLDRDIGNNHSMNSR